MLNPEQQRAVLKAINRCPKPATTLRIWNAAISSLRYDTGEIAASSEALAEFAEVPAKEARRALAELVKLGALLRPSRGKYAINPNVGWAGSLQRRADAAAETKPVLTLVTS